MLFLSWRVIDDAPQLNESLDMFMLPDGLHKATGKTLEGPAVTKAQHTLKGGSERVKGSLLRYRKRNGRWNYESKQTETDCPAKNYKELFSCCRRLIGANLFLGCSILFPSPLQL